MIVVSLLAEPAAAALAFHALDHEQVVVDSETRSAREIDDEY
jgi:molecular chaperone DnaK (HSP70)